MRLGTWNLAGRWDARHLTLIEAMDYDVLLLTEVSERVELPGYDLHLADLVMAPKGRRSAVASKLPMRPMPDPHGASTMAGVDGFRVCSSILAWRSCGTQAPWAGATRAERTSAAVSAVEVAAPTVWGGDWNHALSGRESGRARSQDSVTCSRRSSGWDSESPASSSHQIEDLLSIDHVAVSKSWVVGATQRHRAFVGETRISDHDAYVVDAARDNV